MNFKKFLWLLLVSSAIATNYAQETDPPETEHHCIWYGECVFQNGHFKNCPYNGPAQLLANETAEKKLLELCPNIYGGPDTPVCCDAAQVASMDTQLGQAAGLFKRCSTCLQNFMLGICAMTCAGDHSKYLTPIIETTEEGIEYIDEIEFRIDEEFVDSVYDSCKNTILSSTGLPVMDFTCPPYNAKTCNAKRWYRYLGDPGMNEFVPFKISYNYTNDDEEESYLGEAKSCNEAYPGKWSCSCLDCPEACPIGEIPTGDEPEFMIGEWNGIAFIVGIVVGTIGVVSVLIATFFCNRFEKPKLNYRFLCGFNQVHDYLSVAFRWWGTFCARNSILVLAISSWIIGGLAYGIQYLDITTNPVELWASQTSQSRIEKDYFDSRFGPFYRTNQIFIKPVKSMDLIYHDTPEGTIEFGPAYEKEFLKEVFELQETIMKIGRDSNAGLEKICTAPVVHVGDEVTIDKCLIQSIYGFFEHDMTYFLAESTYETNEVIYTRNYLNVLDLCLTAPMAYDCYAPYGGPIEPAIAVGGFSKAQSNSSEYHPATAIVLTFLVKNYVDERQMEPAMKWELEFINFLKNYTSERLDIAFSAERSIEDNIEELSENEVSTVIISYAAMFVYIVFALGKVRNPKKFFRESKIVLAIGGIVIVLLSVVCSLGFWSYIGLQTTMLAIEVIPFLVLAVGVDNIFMMVHTFDRVDRIEFPEADDAIGEAIGQIGPSILLTAATELSCFAIGGLSEMPAVKTFAVYAAIAILINFLLQLTTFIALMSLDQKRYEDGRWDLFCCTKGKKPDVKSNEVGLLEKLFTNILSPLLLSNMSRRINLIIFIICTCMSLVVVPSLEPGLDQILSMPQNSHIVKYFTYMAELLEMGAPVYWVVTPGINYTLKSGQNTLCGGQQCNDDSAALILYSNSKYPEITRLARPASSWLDDYLDWLSVDTCCKINKTSNSFCPSESSHSDCVRCPTNWSVGELRPTPETFTRYIQFFLWDLPSPQCAKAGRAAYADGVNYVLDINKQANIGDTYLMQYSISAVTSSEFYGTLRETRKVADKINESFRKQGVEARIFPYCVFFVFYEQYLTIWEDTIYLLGLSILAIFVVTFIITGFDIVSSLIILGMVLIIFVNMCGLMWLWGISLNAVSLVNMVVCLGIAVEFISHTVRSYKVAEGTSLERAHEAFSKTGSSVLAGIVLTNFPGIVVLAFAKSLIFQIFYFRMYLIIVFLGATHGLILLPTVLSYFGPMSIKPKTKKQNSRL